MPSDINTNYITSLNIPYGWFAKKGQFWNFHGFRGMSIGKLIIGTIFISRKINLKVHFECSKLLYRISGTNLTCI